MKVLVVEDSALMRRHLVQLLSDEPDITVAAARSGAEALALIGSFNPDVVTLDVTMPEMDGLTCLRRIMDETPRPVVMVSSLTEAGAEVTLEALRSGAVAAVHKPQGVGTGGLARVRAELVQTVRAAAGLRLRTRNLRQRLARTRARIIGTASAETGGVPAAAPIPAAAPAEGVVLVGVSTGGPGTLEDILPALPAGFPWPVVVAQHMPSPFTATLARRLNELCPLAVVEAAQPVPLTSGLVCIARGGADLVLARRNGRLTAVPVPAGDQLWHPSADRLVDSALSVVDPARLIGVLLTGMGSDGAVAMAELHRRGGRTIAEDESTAVVWGMPRALVERGGAGLVLPADHIAGQLVRWLPAKTG